MNEVYVLQYFDDQTYRYEIISIHATRAGAEAAARLDEDWDEDGGNNYPIIRWDVKP